MKRLTKNEFVAKAQLRHGLVFLYDKVNYLGSQSKIWIGCRIHGYFEQHADSHLQGRGCLKCYNELKRERKLYTTERFIEKAKAIHGNSYNYEKVKYVDTYQKITIICPVHGEFQQRPNDHLNKKGCLKCRYIKVANGNLKTLAEFIKVANKVHNNKYSYTGSVYITAMEKLSIECPKHGVFQQAPNNHINQKQGCPKCRSSKGEILVSEFLTKEKIDFVEQVRLEDCKFKNRLPFDFGIYLNAKLAGLIEYQGEQHFVPVKNWGGERRFRELQIKDCIKKAYCEINNIPFLTINWWEHDPTIKLEEFIRKVKNAL